MCVIVTKIAILFYLLGNRPVSVPRPPLKSEPSKNLSASIRGYILYGISRFAVLACAEHYPEGWFDGFWHLPRKLLVEIWPRRVWTRKSMP